ncbi:MAG: hypothetical protein AAGD22_11160 [Verrucomicrobiota bacterium]
MKNAMDTVREWESATWRRWCLGDGGGVWDSGGVGRRQRWVAVATVVLGWGLYGFAVGYWRAPLQGWYVALKFPMVIFGTMVATGLLNAMLGALLGARTGFRQSVLMVLVSFAVAGLIVGSLSPLAFFMVLNAPAPGTAEAVRSYSAFMIVHTLIIAYAGIVANLKLLKELRRQAESAGAASRVLVSWLAANLFVGAQVFWIFRPWFGQPRLPVQFLRDEPMDGNFYEAIWWSIQNLSR